MSDSDDLYPETAPDALAGKRWADGRWQIAVVVAVLAAGVVANLILSNASAVPQVRAAGTGPVAVSVVQPEVQDTQIRLQETGTVQVRNSVELIPQASGRVVAVNPALASGGSFRKGEVLFRLDDADYRAAIERTRADLAARRADLQVEQAEADIARREWELVQPGQPIPANVAREPQLARAEAAVRSAEAALADAQRSLARVNFSLPFAGRVQATTVEIGQNLMAGQSYGRAYAIGGIEVSVPLNPVVLEGLAPARGRRAVVRSRQRLQSQREIAYRAIVSRADAELDPQTLLARLTLEFIEPVPLLPGDFVNVQITGPVVPGTYQFPESALQENRSVWVVVDGHLERREPQLVFTQDGIISALPFDSGDGIVISPLNNPQKGEPVTLAAGTRP